MDSSVILKVENTHTNTNIPLYATSTTSVLQEKTVNKSMLPRNKKGKNYCNGRLKIIKRKKYLPTSPQYMTLPQI